MNINFNMGGEKVAELISDSSRLTVGDALKINAQVMGNKIAIEQDDIKLSYEVLHLKTNILANGLNNLGIERGDRIAVLSENNLEYCQLVYAAAKIGAIVCCINWRLSPDEILYCLKLTTPKALVLSNEYIDTYKKINSETTFTKHVITIDNAKDLSGSISFESLMFKNDASDPDIEVLSEDALVIIYTSGTTGHPKGAIISHRAIFGRMLLWLKDLDYRPEDTYIAWAPMFHMASMDQIIVSGIVGGKIILMANYDAEKIAHYLYTERIGWLLLMPGTFEPILKILNSSEKEIVGVKMVGSMADLTPPEMIAKITAKLKCPYLNTFGSTETGLAPATKGLLTIGEKPTDLFKEKNTVGVVRLVDQNDQDVAQGEPGELILRAPTLFSGYWNNEQANLEAFRSGWYHTGDVFISSEDGKINFVDRSKYLIKSGGENIYPAEIENVLKTHDAVAEAIVVKQQDEQWGEVPKAFVACKNGVTTNVDELLNYCKSKMASYKKPKSITFVREDDIPRNTTGKIIRTEIEKW